MPAGHSGVRARIVRHVKGTAPGVEGMDPLARLRGAKSLSRLCFRLLIGLLAEPSRPLILCVCATRLTLAIDVGSLGLKGATNSSCTGSPKISGGISPSSESILTQPAQAVSHRYRSPRQ